MEIRRIREGDAPAVVELWDRMCAEVRDGGPLTEAGRGHLTRMLAATARHHNAFCLVAVDGEPEDRRFWAGLGFEADLLVMSRYAARQHSPGSA
jgi:hypothetical protein